MNKNRKKNNSEQRETETPADMPAVERETPEIEQDADTRVEEAALKIADLEKQTAELKDLYLRSQAEMENLRRRTQIELEKRSKYAVSAFAADLLTVEDNLKRAVAAVPESETKNPAVKNMLVGLEMTRKDLTNALEKNGIRPIESVGKIFDPNYHKVVQEVEDASQPAGTIVQEWQTGYTIGDRVLREAVVVVTKGGVRPHGVDTTA